MGNLAWRATLVDDAWYIHLKYVGTVPRYLFKHTTKQKYTASLGSLDDLGYRCLLGGLKSLGVPQTRKIHFCHESRSRYIDISKRFPSLLIHRYPQQKKITNDCLKQIIGIYHYVMSAAHEVSKPSKKWTFAMRIAGTHWTELLLFQSPTWPTAALWNHKTSAPQVLASLGSYRNR